MGIFFLAVYDKELLEQGRSGKKKSHPLISSHNRLKVSNWSPSKTLNYFVRHYSLTLLLIQLRPHTGSFLDSSLPDIFSNRNLTAFYSPWVAI